jgi:8-oxo-dGTP pyrophosphatase MutT (NUDIX family)
MLFGPCEGGGEDVVLTERAQAMRSHPGQVSFPGGAVEPGDGGPAGAALREAHEEVGVAPDGIEVVAALPSVYVTASAFVVTPVVGWWAAPTPFGALDTREVSHAVRMPLEHLIDPRSRFSVVHPRSGYVGPAFEVDRLFIWGFTAGLLSAVVALAGLERPWDRSVRRSLPQRFMPGGAQDGVTQAAAEVGRS